MPEQSPLFRGTLVTDTNSRRQRMKPLRSADRDGGKLPDGLAVFTASSARRRHLHTLLVVDSAEK